MGFWRAENVFRYILYRAEQNHQLPNASHAFRVERIPPGKRVFQARRSAFFRAHHFDIQRGLVSMSTILDELPRHRSCPAAVILRIGLIAGAFDITDSIVFNAFRSITPKMIFQYIASGLIGLTSFKLGYASVVMGVVIHFCIALAWTAIFYGLSRKFSVLVRRPIASGLVFGSLVYVIMNFVVLPLSRVPAPTRAIPLASRVNGVLALLFCIGLTVSLLVRRESLGA